MNRRGFLSGILASTAAPAIVRADSLMKIVVPQQGLEPWQLWTSWWVDRARAQDMTVIYRRTAGGFLVPAEFSDKFIHALIDLKFDLADFQ